MNPTARTLKHLRALGYTADKTEHWNGYAKVRQDLYGFIDAVGIRDHETVGVQATTYSNISARIRKIKELPAARTWILAGNKIWVHGWRKVKNRWVVSTREITLEMLEAEQQ